MAYKYFVTIGSTRKDGSKGFSNTITESRVKLDNEANILKWKKELSEDLDCDNIVIFYLRELND